MEVTEVGIKDLLVIKPRIFEDERGLFFESYNTSTFKKIGIDISFLQDNESTSSKGVLRGLHFQQPPHAQGKLVRVVTGSVLDLAVDIRRNSPTYGQYFSIELNGRDKTMLWIPAGFAHGFIALEDKTVFSYKCTALYHKESEQCLLWNDEQLNIDWGYTDPLVSEKDQQGIRFHDFHSPF
jgi:dTDP-4-dehydrorhamnose 3,5-epimerase